MQIKYIDFYPNIQDLCWPILTLGSNQTGLFTNILWNALLLPSIKPPLLMLLPPHGMCCSGLCASLQPDRWSGPTSDTVPTMHSFSIPGLSRHTDVLSPFDSAALSLLESCLFYLCVMFHLLYWSVTSLSKCLYTLVSLEHCPQCHLYSNTGCNNKNHISGN